MIVQIGLGPHKQHIPPLPMLLILIISACHVESQGASLKGPQAFLDILYDIPWQPILSKCSKA